MKDTIKRKVIRFIFVLVLPCLFSSLTWATTEIETAVVDSADVRAIGAVVTDASSGTEAAGTILSHLSGEQLRNTEVIADETPAMGKLLKKFDVKFANPLWNKGLRRAGDLKRSVKEGISERLEFLKDPSHRIDAIYFVVIRGLVFRGWLYVRASDVSPAHFNTSIGAFANLAFFQSLGFIYSIIPNRFASTTAWTTSRLHRLFGQDESVAPTELWKLSGNAVTQLAINTVSHLLNTLNPGIKLLDRSELEAVALNTVTGVSVDYFVQTAYARFDELKVQNDSNLLMTDYFLRRLGMVSGALASWLAPTAELQNMRGRAWAAQALEVGLWAYVATRFDSIAKFTEHSKVVKGVFEFENLLTNKLAHRLKRRRAEPFCLSILEKY